MQPVVNDPRLLQRRPREEDYAKLASIEKKLTDDNAAPPEKRQKLQAPGEAQLNKKCITGDLVNFYRYVSKNSSTPKYYNPNVPVAPEHPFRSMVVGPSGAMKTNFLLNIIDKCSCFDRIDIVCKLPDEPLYASLSNDPGLKGKVFIHSELSQLPRLDELDGSIQRLVVLDDMVTVGEYTKPIKDLFIAARKANCSLAYLSQVFYRVDKDIRDQMTHVFMRSINSVKEMKRIVSEYMLGVDLDTLLAMYHEAMNEERHGKNFFSIRPSEVQEKRFGVGFDHFFDTRNYERPAGRRAAIQYDDEE